MIDTAMIFAAGRGERMRPLTDTCPKPLLEAGGKPLIVWQIEALARAGIARIVINHAWLGERLEAALGDGGRWGVALLYSPEREALETAGGIAQALPLIERAGGPTRFLAVSGDIYTAYDYRRLLERTFASDSAMHLVMVPNPPYHPNGDFALSGERLSLTDTPRLTFGNIGVYDSALFHDLTPGACRALTPYYQAAIRAGRATGERFTGLWENIGTPAQLQALDDRLRARSAVAGGGLT